MPLPVAWPVTQILYDISPRRLLIFINKCRCFYKDFYVRKYTHTSNWHPENGVFTTLLLPGKYLAMR